MLAAAAAAAVRRAGCHGLLVLILLCGRRTVSSSLPSRWWIRDVFRQPDPHATHHRRSVVCPLAAELPSVPLSRFCRSWSDGLHIVRPDAVDRCTCSLDGSPYGHYFTPSPTGSNQWTIFMQVLLPASDQCSNLRMHPNIHRLLCRVVGGATMRMDASREPQCSSARQSSSRRI